MKTSINVFAKAWLMAKFGQRKFGGNVKDYFISAVKLAWQQVKTVKIKTVKDITKADLIQIMLNHTLIISFIKKDGTKRFMFGTLNSEYIKQHQTGMPSTKTKTRTVPEHQVIIFDAEINEYRSFIIDNLVDYAVI